MLGLLLWCAWCTLSVQNCCFASDLLLCRLLQSMQDSPPGAAAAAAAAASSIDDVATRRESVDLVLELDGVQQRECCLLTEDRRIKLPSEWAQQLQLDTIKLQAQDGRYVLGFFESTGPCSGRTFEEVCRLLGWDTNNVPGFGSAANPVHMTGGVAGNRCQCMPPMPPQGMFST